MMDKYLSIITNFGCHYKCPYCNTKVNNIKVPKTTVHGLNELENKIKETGANIISISGGGDPLYNYPKNIQWYWKLFGITDYIHIPVEMHTSYMPAQKSSFPFGKCYRVVYHLNSYDQLKKIQKMENELIRVVFVVTEDFSENNLLDISEYVKNSEEIDELSFRQLVGENYETKYYLHDFLKAGHGNKWHYIEQNDYNIYYCENEIYYKFSEIGADKYVLQK